MHKSVILLKLQHETKALDSTLYDQYEDAFKIFFSTLINLIREKKGQIAK